MKRVFDFVFSFLGLVILLPLFIFIGILILIDDFGPVFYLQKRVGLNNVEFRMIKFRTMYINADQRGLLTVGDDSRITYTGKFLRKYKLDELPQLINVFIGQMSLVGPRPEVRKYVELYTDAQKEVLTIKPGITDYASIQYSNENEILAQAEEPERTYIEEIMPHKLQINLQYINNRNFLMDIKIILQTIKRIIR